MSNVSSRTRGTWIDSWRLRPGQAVALVFHVFSMRVARCSVETERFQSADISESRVFSLHCFIKFLGEFGTITRWTFYKMLLRIQPKKHHVAIFRANDSIGSRGQLRSKGHGKLSIHYAATQATIESVFRIIGRQSASNVAEHRRPTNQGRSRQKNKIPRRTTVFRVSRKSSERRSDNPRFQLKRIHLNRNAGVERKETSQ